MQQKNGQQWFSSVVAEEKQSPQGLEKRGEDFLKDGEQNSSRASSKPAGRELSKEGKSQPSGHQLHSPATHRIRWLEM